MGLYPIFVDTAGRKVLVIGGGHVADEKVRGLLAADVAVTVVSPKLHPQIAVEKAYGRIEHLCRPYVEEDLDGGWDWVMVATDDGAINAEVTAACRERSIWVNSADDPANCDFILPAIVRKGRITLAASTGGASPALARRLREELDAYLTEDMPALADLLAEARQTARSAGTRIENDTWQEAIDEPLRVLLAQRKYVQARAKLFGDLGLDSALQSDTDSIAA
jgi:precorrin-2 dehydrogenase/sirohydrochlorin ferrochelatase